MLFETTFKIISQNEHFSTTMSKTPNLLTIFFLKCQHLPTKITTCFHSFQHLPAKITTLFHAFHHFPAKINVFASLLHPPHLTPPHPTSFHSTPPHSTPHHPIPPHSTPFQSTPHRFVLYEPGHECHTYISTSWLPVGWKYVEFTSPQPDESCPSTSWSCVLFNHLIHSLSRKICESRLSPNLKVCMCFLNPGLPRRPRSKKLRFGMPISLQRLSDCVKHNKFVHSVSC